MPSSATSPRYQWVLERTPESLSSITPPHDLRIYLVSFAVFAAALMLPPVTRATGLSPLTTLAILAPHPVCCVLVTLRLFGWARRSLTGFHVMLHVIVAVGLAIVTLLPALSGQPRTPLWMLAVVYAAMNGSIPGSPPSRVLLLGHTLAPLLALPAFRGSDDPWALAGPLLCSAAAGATYHFIAQRTASSRNVRRELDEALERLRQKEQELSRAQLARDLHDSVGSALGLLALHADLVEKSAEDPAQVRRLAQLAREAATDGLGDLRGVLEALTPPGDSLDALAEALHELAHRRAAPSGTQVSITVESGGTTALDPAVRLALVRIAQEGLRNAISHGRANRVDIRLSMSSDGLRLVLADDGAGFDPARVRKGARGLAGMRARASELGGTLQLDAAPDRGCRLELLLPPRPAHGVAA